MTPTIETVAAGILEAAAGSERFIVAIAGPPGAGKSTLADRLVSALCAARPCSTTCVPMDGFHLDNAVLRERGLLERKGAPETFDVDGLRTTLRRLRWPREPVAVPLFDRDLDLARAGGRVVAPTQSIVLVEGNYLLLDTPPWSGLSGLFDCTIAIQADIDELRQRLIARWLEQGLTPELAAARADTNDMANARLVDAGSQRADIVCQI